MSDNRDDKLDTLLRSRWVAPASPDLTRRIILRAQQTPQLNMVPLWRLVHDLFGEFHLPKPVYVLASALVVGAVIGFSVPQDVHAPSDDAGVSMHSFLLADEAW
jgi:hypothetical protein